MSFSLDTKNELARAIPEKKCCMLAEIAAFIRMSGTVRLAGGGRLSLKVSTDNPAVARHFKKLLREYFGANSNILAGHANFRKAGHGYEMGVEEPTAAELVLRETGVLRVREGCNYIDDGIYEGVIRTKCCRKAYLKGLFLGGGSVTDPEKAYHLEVVCRSAALAGDVRKLLNSFVDIHGKLAPRKKHFVVYLKESEQILDILNIMGAHNQLLKLENIRIVKDLRNRTNRITNCDSANVDKAIQAAEKQIADIERLRGAAGLDALPQGLRDLAVLRLENPDASMSELGEMLSPPLKKSGVSHRFRKLGELAGRL
ncbi:MAG: DNA-binding protein WhiA [Clostridiales Family XIII bacterium]|jgi:DNA-binding protein WhiA|nr:DNA-binding protein WhiA [Clostridiales Family XIII bacterium]